MHEGERRSLQQIVEESAVGRAVLSAFIAVTVITLVVINLPPSHLRGEVLSKYGDAYTNALGLDQGWGVFAPNPRRQVIALEGKVFYADGSTSLWRPPRSGPVLGSYWDFRWRKYMELIRADRRAFLWAPLAVYIARDQRGSRKPVRVELTRRWYPLYAPGRGDGLLHGPWESYKFFTLDETGLKVLGVT